MIIVVWFSLRRRPSRGGKTLAHMEDQTAFPLQECCQPNKVKTPTVELTLNKHIKRIRAVHLEGVKKACKTVPATSVLSHKFDHIFSSSPVKQAMFLLNYLITCVLPILHPDTNCVFNCILSGAECHWQGNEAAMMTDSRWQQQHSGLWS